MQKKFFQFILFFFNIFKFISCTYSFGTPISKVQENFEYSMEKDMGQCTCDLSSFCDYNCPCDKDCGYTEIEGIDRLEEYKCKSLREKFKFNKNEAGISIKDHIFSLMCIHTDNSGDMGEFYKETPNENNEDKKNNWINDFFQAPNSQDNQESINLYKPDSNGYCMKTYISELKNTQFSCIRSDKVNLNIGENNAYEIQGLPEKTGGFYYINSKTNIIDFKVSWNTNQENNLRPKGYLQGSFLKINYGYIYDQYYLPIINNEGYCLSTNEIPSAISIKPFLFKNNAIYSCKVKNGIIDTFLYNFLLSDDRARICSSPDKEDCNINIKGNKDIEDTNQDININLYIFTSKEGKESSLYEIIKGSLITANQISSNAPILTLNIKFIDVSSSSYYNSKDGIITSLSSLPKKILDSISIND